MVVSCVSPSDGIIPASSYKTAHVLFNPHKVFLICSPAFWAVFWFHPPFVLPRRSLYSSTSSRLTVIMPSLLLVAFIAIASLQGTFGAPSCGSKDLGSCISKCKAKMGHHTWGSLSYNPNSVPTSSYESTDKPTSAAANVEGTTPTSAPTTPSSTPPAVASTQPASSTPPASNSSVSSADIQSYLSAHNSVRAQHGAAPLTWSNSLSSVAQAWANGCVFQHSKGQYGGMYLPLEAVVVS